MALQLRISTCWAPLCTIEVEVGLEARAVEKERDRERERERERGEGANWLVEWSERTRRGAARAQGGRQLAGGVREREGEGEGERGREGGMGGRERGREGERAHGRCHCIRLGQERGGRWIRAWRDLVNKEADSSEGWA